MIKILIVFVLAFVGLLLAVIGSRIKKGMSIISMYNIATCLIIASIISCVISFFAICIALPGNSSKAVTQQEVIVDIFSVLVTVLMGWNIISVVDFKRNAEKLNTLSNDLDLVISSMIDLNFSSFDLRKDKENVINSCFNMLEEIQNCESEPFKKSTEKKVVHILRENMRPITGDQKILINKDERKHYLFILEQIDGVYVDDVRDMISTAIEKGSPEERDYLRSTEETAEYVMTTGANVNN